MEKIEEQLSLQEPYIEKRGKVNRIFPLKSMTNITQRDLIMVISVHPERPIFKEG